VFIRFFKSHISCQATDGKRTTKVVDVDQLTDFLGSGLMPLFITRLSLLGNDNPCLMPLDPIPQKCHPIPSPFPLPAPGPAQSRNTPKIYHSWLVGSFTPDLVFLLAPTIPSLPRKS